MRKLLLLGAMALAGCTGTGAIPPSPGPGLLSPLVDSGVISEETRTKARQAQAATKNYCDYVPTIGTLIALFSAGVGGPAAAIGKIICDAVTTAPLADGGGRLAYVNGVRIYGRFVK